MKTKIIAVILILPLIWPFQAQAILGIVDTSVVTDPVHTIVNIGGWIKDIAIKVIEFAKDVALATLTKVVIDELTERTIKWIQGEGDPRFFRNFDNVFKDAINVAIGDILIDIGAGALCSYIPTPKIRLQLEKPVFKRQIQCTLNQVVRNVASFYNRFGEAGWIGYSEVLKPQNNKWGVEILTYDELTKKTGAQVKAKETELTVGSGFLSTKKVLEWTLINESTGMAASGIRTRAIGKLRDIALNERNPISSGDLGFSEDPKKPPTPRTEYFDGYYVWRPTNTEVTTPGKTIAASLDKALGSNLDFIVNAKSQIVGAAALILDAAINRLIQKGVEGLAKLTLDKEQLTEEELRDSGWLLGDEVGSAIQSSEAAGETYKSAALSGILDQVNNALANLDSASSTIREDGTANDYLITLLGDSGFGLIQCLEEKTGQEGVADALVWTNSAKTAAQNRTAEINTTRNSINTALAPFDGPDGIRTKLRNNEAVDINQQLLQQAQEQGISLRQIAERLLGQIREDSLTANRYYSQFSCGGQP